MMRYCKTPIRVSAKRPTPTTGTTCRRAQGVQGQVAEGDKTYLLRLIVEDWHSPPVIVTVYRTSKINKYWVP